MMHGIGALAQQYPPQDDVAASDMYPSPLKPNIDISTSLQPQQSDSVGAILEPGTCNCNNGPLYLPSQAVETASFISIEERARCGKKCQKRKKKREAKEAKRQEKREAKEAKKQEKKEKRKAKREAKEAKNTRKKKEKRKERRQAKREKRQAERDKKDKRIKRLRGKLKAARGNDANGEEQMDDNDGATSDTNHNDANGEEPVDDSENSIDEGSVNNHISGTPQRSLKSSLANILKKILYLLQNYRVHKMHSTRMGIMIITTMGIMRKDIMIMVDTKMRTSRRWAS